ncbi:ABC transporter substrate-binding protein [Alicyclobacillus acidiphilus]|uniref:ABC transporter substrate-binding protein n=1 Tax=Alicyclobacillus acidiphilus TaxID=182455 RepID=UPI000836DF88|nr:ABC transporter substrate-binding protein [Alicyclobacillus acidiphilus]
MKRNWARLALLSSVVTVATGVFSVSQAYAASNPPLTIDAQTTSSWSDNFNPFVIGNVQMPNGYIYESLFYFSTTGPQYNMLGTKMAWSNANKTLTVTVRSGVKWNDGQPFTAKDVAFTYNLLKKYPDLDSNLIWQSLSSVKAIGNTKVQFQFKTQNVPFAQTILSQVPIVPQHIWSQVKGDPSKWADPKPVGTGPFVLGTFTPQNYTLKANPHYWGGNPPVPELIFPALSGNDSADLELTSGKLGWATLFIQNVDKTYIKADPKDNHYFFPAVADLSIFPNLKNPILKNLVVREAISDAINRPQLDNIGEYGYEPPSNPTGLILPNQKQWLKPGLNTKFTYSVSAANALLDKAGYKMGSDGVRVSPTGQKLEFNLIAPNGWTDWNEDESLIAQDLKQIGIQINVQEPQQADWTNDLVTHKFDLALESSSYTQVGSTPFQGLKSYFYPGASANYEQYNDPATTKALDTFQHTTNLTQQKQAMYTVETQFEKNLPVIPLLYAVNYDEYSTANYTNWPNASNNYVDSSPAISFADAIVVMHLKPSK